MEIAILANSGLVLRSIAKCNNIYMGEEVVLDPNNIARLVYLLLILSSISGWIIVSLRRDFSKTFQTALIWFLIFFGLIGAYGIWTDITGKVIFDSQTSDNKSDVYRIKKSADGHYYSTARINGTKIRLLVDTGATKTLITLEDAKKIGVNLSNLEFKNPIQTANGISYSADFVVDDFEWLGKKIDNMRIQITQANLFSSLLGMDVIDSSSAFVLSGDLLTIRF